MSVQSASGKNRGKVQDVARVRRRSRVRAQMALHTSTSTTRIGKKTATNTTVFSKFRKRGNDAILGFNWLFIRPAINNTTSGPVCQSIPYSYWTWEDFEQFPSHRIPLTDNRKKMNSKPLAGLVCLVTGATRGIGKGIAVQLGEKGATVYITGRNLDTPKGSVGGSLKDTAQIIESRGGQCIPVQCDHSKDADVQRLFEQIQREQDGRLDLLVNNAYSGVGDIMKNSGISFWEQPLSMWDDVNTVGLRNHYICGVLAAKMMVPRKMGLIVNISSAGGLTYLFNVPYGIGKEACDRMAADCAVELRKHKVAFVSLWPGPVKTEMVTQALFQDDRDETKARRSIFETSESAEFAGMCIVELLRDPNIMEKSGKILLTHSLGKEYRIKDLDGYTPLNIRQMNRIFQKFPVWLNWLAWIIPDSWSIPTWVLAMKGNKMY